jgi:excisionase family DNA binding protein
MVTVPEAARRTGRNPETIRRWIRSGRLPAQRVGTQHMIEEADLDAITFEPDVLAVPREPTNAGWGDRLPALIGILREHRER